MPIEAKYKQALAQTVSELDDELAQISDKAVDECGMGPLALFSMATIRVLASELGAEAELDAQVRHENRKACLRKMLRENGEIEPALKAKYFYMFMLSPAHDAIAETFNALVAVWRRDGSVDLARLKQELKDVGMFDFVGGDEFFNNLFRRNAYH